jgi:hypothetical protein
MLAGDADLCPSDLPVIPIQVSLRDVIVLAFTNGMAVTYACPYPTKVISMQGPPGFLSSAEHPILGTIIHFTAQRVNGNYGITLNGKINAGWMHRLVADCRVAGSDFTPFERDYIERSEGLWMKKLIQKVEPAQQAWGYPVPSESASAPASNPFAPRSVDSVLEEYPNPFLPLQRNMEDAGAKHFASANSTVCVKPGGDKHTESTGSTSTRTKLVPWRNPWCVEVPKDPAHFVLVPFQSAGRGRQASPACDAEPSARPPDLPDAPDAPLSLALAPGVNDGSWNFLMEKNTQVVFILPVASESAPESVTKHHWPLWLRDILLTSGKQMAPNENAPFLPVFQAAVSAGWRMAKGRRIIPRFLPLPEAEDLDLSTSTDDNQFFSPPSPLPPDFLDSRIALDSGRGIQSPIRSYQAIAKQQSRRITKEMESLDLLLLKAGPTRQLLESPHPAETGSPKRSCPALAESFESKTFPKIRPYLNKKRKPQKRIQQHITPLMIEARDSTDNEWDNVKSQRGQSSHKSLSAYMESVASEDESSLSEADGHIGCSSNSDNSPPPSPNGSISGNKPYSHSPSLPRIRQWKRRTASERQEHEGGWGSASPNPWRASWRDTKKPASGTSKSKGVTFMEGVTAGDSTDSSLESCVNVYSPSSSPIPQVHTVKTIDLWQATIISLRSNDCDGGNKLKPKWRHLEGK